MEKEKISTKVSIILPTYCPNLEVEGHLKVFLTSLAENTNRDSYQFIIIEQGEQSSKRFTDIIKPDIYIHKKEPIGYARAVNLGMALSDCDYIAIMNNDLIVPKDWLVKMLKDHELGTLAPLDDCWNRPENKVYKNSHWFSLVLMDRNTFIKVGYLDESMPYRFHDQDYSIRVHKAGFSVNRTGNVIVQHINRATFDAMGRPGNEEEEEMMKKRYGAITYSEWLRL